VDGIIEPLDLKDFSSLYWMYQGEKSKWKKIKRTES